jgi:hypothetical protein
MTDRQEVGRVDRRDTVFASGEAETADAAYTLAHRSLWERIGRIDGARMRGVEHSTATRVRDETSLNAETFEVETRSISVVLVTLLASITITTEGN